MDCRGSVCGDNGEICQWELGTGPVCQ
jgi:hypothetical protein